MTKAGGNDGGHGMLASDRHPAAPPPRRAGEPMNPRFALVALPCSQHRFALRKSRYRRSPSCGRRPAPG